MNFDLDASRAGGAQRGSAALRAVVLTLVALALGAALMWAGAPLGIDGPAPASSTVTGPETPSPPVPAAESGA
jgi:hypothetical protein